MCLTTRVPKTNNSWFNHIPKWRRRHLQEENGYGHWVGGAAYGDEWERFNLSGRWTFFFWGSWGERYGRVIFSWRSQIVFLSFRRQQGKAEAVRASGQQITFIRCHRDKSYSSWRRMFNNKKNKKKGKRKRPTECAAAATAATSI